MPRDYRLPGHINFNEGFAGCQDRMAILEAKLAPRNIANDPSIPVMDINDIGYGIGDDCCDINNPTDTAYILVDNNGTPMKLPLAKFLFPGGANADWNAEIEDGVMPASYILNKPTIKVRDIFGSEGFISEVQYGSIMEGDWIDPDASAMDLLRKMMTRTDRVPLIYGQTFTPSSEGWIYHGPDGDRWWSYPEEFVNAPNPYGALEYKITGAIDSEGVYQYFEKGSRYPTKQELIRDGATIKFDFEDKHMDPVPGYFYIGIPRTAELVCFGIFQGGHFIEFDEGWIREEKSCEYNGNHLTYDIYRLAYPTVGKFTVRFAFRDAFDPRVHPELRYPGGSKLNMADLRDMLKKVFVLDSEGNIFTDSEGIPTIKPEACPCEEILADYATEEDLVKEINERVRDINILKQLINGDSVDIEELKKYVYMLFPSTFGAGGSEGTVLPDTVAVGGKYVLEAQVRESDGRIHLRWNRFENNSPHGNATVYDGKTIYINENGQVAVKLNSEGPLTATSEGITLKLSDSFKMTDDGLKLRISEGDIPFDNASIRWNKTNNYYYIPFDQDTIGLTDKNAISVNLNSEMFFAGDSEGIKIRHDNTIIINSEGLSVNIDYDTIKLLGNITSEGSEGPIYDDDLKLRVDIDAVTDHLEIMTSEDVIRIWHELMP